MSDFSRTPAVRPVGQCRTRRVALDELDPHAAILAILERVRFAGVDVGERRKGFDVELYEALRDAGFAAIGAAYTALLHARGATETFDELVVPR